MTEEEKKAFYKARGEAAAAARAAKKAATAENADSDSESEAEEKPKKSKKPVKPAESEDEASDSEDEDAEPVAVKPYIWEHAMEGKESKKYERADIDGKVYLCHYKTKEFLGVWDEQKNKIKKAENPFA
jgi:hypothetical protein